ncbi:hypothetical protein IC229_28825 [Spirosoma sp. BT702]|uniref:Uncharacterized protein n=1 Tax=Spirosoma profusum TaxID=2771354 RepID=A0A926Y5G5_9BACT|nr:hypothetical protein [Spirosoma profusum]MBD2704675.1 hypothetical protein [Spirosoma profusum]
MTGDVAVVISWLALLATLYQLYLQRIHNEKSLKPLGQIDVEDRQGHFYVYVTNKGMGPMLIDQLLFVKDGKTYTTIDPCLNLVRQSYTAISVNETVQKVILPNGHLVIFETRLEKKEEDRQRVRQQLSAIRLKVAFRDIYNNKLTIERDLHWFLRYDLKEGQM